MPQIEGVDAGVRIGTFEPYRSVDQFGMVAFPSLELLNILGLDNVEKIWHNQLLEDSFSQLKEIRVASCGKLLNIFPSTSLVRDLVQLQDLRVSSCGVEELVVKEDGVETTPRVKTFAYKIPTFQEVHLEGNVNITIQQPLALFETV
ncbi:hypothetical protein CK203_110687 [Vitis vinifera]|uniref:Disease resistance protein At4g27190-like leucine-rich repeats domain-containing protein n=1 Tax=Vitis vinifera TaxID=29760 RepID=A0A438FDW3_VITVI|nr:hypothetical protein CK203_110687 [Vitis vinifera]